MRALCRRTHPDDSLGAVFGSFRDDVKGVAFTLKKIITIVSQHFVDGLGGEGRLRMQLSIILKLLSILTGLFH